MKKDKDKKREYCDIRAVSHSCNVQNIKIIFQKSKMDFVLEHPSLGKTVFSVSEERSFEKWFTALNSAVDPTTL